MSKYYYEKVNLSDNNKSTSTEEDNEYIHNITNINSYSKKLKIKYTYTHYTKYLHYSV